MAITSEHLREARQASRRGDAGKGDLRDDRVRSLVLRRRGASLSWLYKTRARSLRIGCGHALGLGEARREAARIMGDEEAVVAARDEARAAATGRSFGAVLDAFTTYRSQPRRRGDRDVHPKEATLRDLRLAFRREAVTARRDTPVGTMWVADLEAIRDEIHRRHSPRQADKALSYIKSALNHAYRTDREATRLQARWWRDVEAVELVGEEAVAAAAHARPLAVPDLGVEELRVFLARHDAFCEENAVSPAVRYGMHWLVLTGQRSTAAVRVRWDGIRTDVDGLPEGWRAAVWEGRYTKNKLPFVLPLPPALVSVLEEVRWRVGGNGEWVFPGAGDNPLGESALRQHLARLRGWRSVDRTKRRIGPDVLADLPQFTLHAIRSTLATHLDNDVDLPDGTSSLVLGHTTPAQRQAIEAVPTVTSRHYSRAQRIERKARGMRVWVEAVTRTA